MNINFTYLGLSYKADVAKQTEEEVIVLFKDGNLEKQFGSSLPFHVSNKSVSFNELNRSHSELYALNSSISKAITEQCREFL